MDNWLFWLTVIALIGGMLYGHYRGFLRTALSLASLLVTAVLARLLLSPLSKLTLELVKVEGFSEIRFNTILYILLFILIYLLIRMFIKAMDIVSRIPIVHGLNQLAGAALGGIIVLIFIWMLFIAANKFAGASWADEVLKKIGESRFLTFLSEKNLLIILLQRLFPS